jgi:hypothetical protein
MIRFMKKRGKRFAVAGVLLTHVVLRVFVLGFTGCDWIKSILGMEEGEPTPPPEDPVHLRLYVGVPVEGSNPTNSEEVPLGTKENPFPMVAAALDRVAAAYAVEGEESAEAPAKVEPWPGKNAETPGTGKPAEIVIVGTIESGPITINGSYPPITLRDSPGTDGAMEFQRKDSLITVGAGQT